MVDVLFVVSLALNVFSHLSPSQGKPRALFLNPISLFAQLVLHGAEGAMLSHELETHFLQRGVQLVCIAGAAPWQVGLRTRRMRWLRGAVEEIATLAASATPLLLQCCFFRYCAVVAATCVPFC